LQKSNFSNNTTEYPLEDTSNAQPSPEAPPPITIKSNFLLLFNNLIFEDLFNFKELF
jgi:hypothetical protein